MAAVAAVHPRADPATRQVDVIVDHFFFSSRRRHTRSLRDWSSDVCSSDLYKSTDGGKTWMHIGLEDSRQIGRIIVDPRDPNRVFAAALGHAYGPNAERG